MDLVRLHRREHPAPPQHELRGRTILDSHERYIGNVEGIYVDREDRKSRLVEIGMGGFMGLGRKHYLFPVEAIDDTFPGAIHLSVSEEDIKSSPSMEAHQEIDLEMQKTIYEHYGYVDVILEDHQHA